MLRLLSEKILGILTLYLLTDSTKCSNAMQPLEPACADVLLTCSVKPLLVRTSSHESVAVVAEHVVSVRNDTFAPVHNL